MTPLQKKRQKIVKSHMDTELHKDAEATVATFDHPRYEVIPTGEVYDGKKAVRGFLKESMVAFPDFSFEEHCLHHTQDAVVVEITFHGTHNGPWRGLPATGKKISYRMC